MWSHFQRLAVQPSPLYKSNGEKSKMAAPYFCILPSDGPKWTYSSIQVQLYEYISDIQNSSEKHMRYQIIGHVIIRIIFLCNGNSQRCWENAQSRVLLSDWLLLGDNEKVAIHDDHYLLVYNEIIQFGWQVTHGTFPCWFLLIKHNIGSSIKALYVITGGCKARKWHPHSTQLQKINTFNSNKEILHRRHESTFCISILQLYYSVLF